MITFKIWKNTQRKLPAFPNDIYVLNEGTAQSIIKVKIK